MHEGALADFFAGVSVGYEESFGEFGEVVVDVDLRSRRSISKGRQGKKRGVK